MTKTPSSDIPIWRVQLALQQLTRELEKRARIERDDSRYEAGNAYEAAAKLVREQQAWLLSRPLESTP